MVRGLDTFAAFFAGDQSRYVLIGGVASQLVLEAAGLQARATKDLDIVLCIESLDVDFGRKLWSFIDAGGYLDRQRSEGRPCFYRFIKPSDPSYPQMLEFFAREPGHAPLLDDAHLTPVPFEQQVQSLSAILLDNDYYAFLHRHTRLLSGVNVVTEKALIPLKARAWLDIVARKEREPDAVDGKHIRKHCNDVLRLSQLLSDTVRIEVPRAIRGDLERFCEGVAASVTMELLGDLEIDESPEALLARLSSSFHVRD